MERGPFVPASSLVNHSGGFAGFGPGKRGASLAHKLQFHFPCAFIFAHLALAEADNAAFQAALL